MIDDTKSNSATAHLGYSDEKLEMLSSVQARFESGIAPWAGIPFEALNYWKLND